MSSQNYFFIDGNEPMISARKAAKRLGVAQDYIGKLCREGKLRGRLVGNGWHVSESSIVEFEAARVKARAERSEELSKLRKYENDLFRKARGLPKLVSQSSAAAPGLFSLLAKHPFTKTAVLSLGGLLIFTAIAFAGAIGYAQRGSTQDLIAALSHVESPFFGYSIPTLSQPTPTSDFFSTVLTYLFGTRGELPLAQQTLPTPTSAAAPQVPTATSTPSQARQTIVQNNTYPVTERTIVRTESGVTQADLDAQLAKLADSLNQEIYNFIHTPPPVVTFQGNTIPPSPSALTLDDASIPDNITVSNYLPLSGGTITGTLTLDNALLPTSGGTGLNTFVTGDILYASAPNTLSVLPISSNGKVLKIAGGVPSWGIDLQGSGGGSSAWATTTDNLAIVEVDPTQVLIVGASATTTTGNILEVSGNALFDNALVAYGTVTGPRFVATTSVASTFPYASSTALTVSGTGYFDTASTTNLTVSSIASGALLKATTAGAIVAATAGTDYSNFAYPFLSNATTTQIAFNGGLTAAGATSTSLAVTGSTTITSVLNAFGGALFGNASSTSFYSASSTLDKFFATNGTTTSLTSASTTLTGNTFLQFGTSSNFAITSVTSNRLKANSTGGIVAAQAGTDYTTPSQIASAYPFQVAGNATSTLTQFNGGLTAYGSSTIGAGTLGTGLTINGGATSTNLLVTGSTTLAGITNIGGALNAAGTVTLSTYTGGALATDVSGTLYTFSTSTWRFASSTLLSDFNTWTGGNTFGNASSTSFYSASSTLDKFFATNGTTTNFYSNNLTGASTTLTGNTVLTNATTTTFAINSQAAGCAQFNSIGSLLSTGINCGTGSGSSDFTYPTDYGVITAATSSPFFT